MARPVFRRVKAEEEHREERRLVHLDRDRALVEAALGDPAAFDALYRKYLAQVYSYAYYELGSHHDAEDAAERTFLLALGALARFEERARPADGAGAAVSEIHPARRRRLPSLPETMARIALLSSANTDESARRLADMTIRVRVSGVGLLEFHQIDAARAAGRRAALAALEDAPEWLRGGQAAPGGYAGRRTVLRV